MLQFFGKIFCLIFFFTLFGAANAQTKENVDVLLIPKGKNILENCRQINFSEILFYTKPVYPKQAKNANLGGTIELTVKIDEKGEVSKVEKIAGGSFFQDAALETAKKIKFTPALCDGAAKPVSGLLVFNFAPSSFSEKYFAPEKIEDFADLNSDSQFYEPILFLTEKKRLAFGYSDKKFHPEAPLTRGDFAQFLLNTLEFLSERAASAEKNARNTNLHLPYNPHNLSSISKPENIKNNKPFTEAVSTLFDTYKIALADKNRNFQGGMPMTNNETIELWTQIFGSDAVPVNFLNLEEDRVLTRGEFALFLRESLEVLTYKNLP